MTTQQKQTQSVKVIVNNQGCCDKKKRCEASEHRKVRHRPRKKTQASQSLQDSRQEDFVLPFAPMKEFARGLSAYPVRPMNYAPTVQMIQTDNGLNTVPSYFEKQFTNQQATLEELQRNLRENFEELATQLNEMSAQQPPRDDDVSSAVWSVPPSPTLSPRASAMDEQENIPQQPPSVDSWKTSQLSGRKVSQLEVDIQRIRRMLIERRDAQNVRMFGRANEIARQMRDIGRTYGYDNIRNFESMLRAMEEKYGRINLDNYSVIG